MSSDRESRFDDTPIGPEDVLEVWFGPPGSDPLAKARLWFTKDDAFDAELRFRFEAANESAARGALDAWRLTPRGRLALVILLDQFSRNMFRGTPRAFAQDARALAYATELIGTQEERALGIAERAFLYLPLEHAEDLARQEECVTLFTELLAEAESGPEELRKTVADYVDYAKKHLAIIERFGRFPHRNAILGRPSTPEEIEFLTQPGSSF